jgi:ergothioneine biosynthesis protein EgtB
MEKMTDFNSRLTAFISSRQKSLSLIFPLSAEDCSAQSMPDCSPAKWHIAHTTWFFETFILEAYEPNFQSFHNDFRFLFNSYYNGISKQFAREQRGLLTRPSLEEVISYHLNVNERILALLQNNTLSIDPLIELGINHEQQHQELLLMDIKNLLSHNPLSPSYVADASEAMTQGSSTWQDYPKGLFEIGGNSNGFHFDNEGPSHLTHVDNYSLHSDLVTKSQYQEFIEDGGYSEPSLWLADGWSFIQKNQLRAPLYWRKIDGDWFEFTLQGLCKIKGGEPTCHISYYEADAYASWQSARLPTEAEWEIAANSTPSLLNNLYDSRWQWTQSAYTPYPGFSATKGAIGEYNGKFMSNQMVLRGGAAISPLGHTRPTYRNFFYPHQSWMYSGIRLARDLK